MHQVAEHSAAERIIPHVLNDAAGIGVGVSVNQVLRSGCRPTLQKQRLDVLVPSRIDNGFVSENGIALQRGSQQQRRTASDRPVHTLRVTDWCRIALYSASHLTIHARRVMRDLLSPFAKWRTLPAARPDPPGLCSKPLCTADSVQLPDRERLWYGREGYLPSYGALQAFRG